MRILIGEISSYKAIVIARHIRCHYPHIELIGYDSKPLLNHVHTRYIDSYVALQKCNKEQYVNELAKCAEYIQADVLIPVHSDYIGDILAHKELFGSRLDYLGKYTDYLNLHEKDRLMMIAKKCDIRTPINYTSVKEAKIPFVVKPNNKSSAKGVQYCFSEYKREKITRLDHYLCQEYVEGIGCGYETYCKNGKIVVDYGHIRLAEYPVSGGSSVWRKGYVHENMRKSAEAILKKVPWTGFAMFEFKLTPKGELVLIEVNPRIWGSINQALQDGVELFADILGEKSTQSEWKGVYTCLSPQIYLALIGYALHGKWRIIQDYWRYRKQTKVDVSFRDDWKGLISMLIRKLL